MIAILTNNLLFYPLDILLIFITLFALPITIKEKSLENAERN